MHRRLPAKTYCTLLLMGLLCTALPSVDVSAKNPRAEKSQSEQSGSRTKNQALTASEAAARAKARHGGKVLKVSSTGKGYRVKLLTDAGRQL